MSTHAQKVIKILLFILDVHLNASKANYLAPTTMYLLINLACIYNFTQIYVRVLVSK